MRLFGVALLHNCCISELACRFSMLVRVSRALWQDSGNTVNFGRFSAGIDWRVVITISFASFATALCQWKSRAQLSEQVVPQSHNKSK